MKCKRCGKSLFGRGGQKILDGYVCYPCFYELGFEKSDRQLTSPLPYNYEDIERGKAEIWNVIEERRLKHEQWLQEHPDVVEFMNVLEEYGEESPASEDGSTPEDDEIND